MVFIYKICFSLFLLFLPLLSSCHPLRMFRPDKLSTKNPTEFKVKGNPLRAPVEITLDSFGIPYIKADSTKNALYGLGFMHARDRLFQLDLLRHAALGRLSEIFGERTLLADRRLRLLTYRLDDQLALLDENEIRVLKSYVAGVNEGAKHRGRSAQHFFLGVQFEDYSVRDLIAVARLQAWQLSSDLSAELARLEIYATMKDKAVLRELFGSVDDFGAAIIQEKQTFRSKLDISLMLPDGLTQASSQKPDEQIVSEGGGASNAWALHKDLSVDGVSRLMNDPHLRHGKPSNFYIAGMQARGKFVAGSTFPGLPAVLIGFSQKLAWGVTASYLNNQDLVLLKLSEDRKSYEFDGKMMPLRSWPQSFCTSKKDAGCLQEDFKVSHFGPMLGAGYAEKTSLAHRLALQWTGFLVEQHKSIVGPFRNLVSAKNVREGVEHAKSMSLPGVNMILADQNGDVAYSYAGLVPMRDMKQHPFFPLDGKKSSSLWAGVLEKNAEPSIINPSEKFIVTANQNVFFKNSPIKNSFAMQGAPPFRALRIRERIEELIKKDGKPHTDDLASIQQDPTSIEAKWLASGLGQMCLNHFAHSDDRKKEFATLIKDFDGVYHVDSYQALPFETLKYTVARLSMAKLMGKDLANMRSLWSIRYQVIRLIKSELDRKPTAFFKKVSGGFASVVNQSCEQAYEKLVKNYGRKKSSWRWGRHHYLRARGPLAQAPLIGGFFSHKKRELAGNGSAPLAESGTPISTGANMRFVAELSAPIKASMILDTGNSGAPSSKNLMDQSELWHRGQAIPMPRNFEEAKALSTGMIRLVPIEVSE